MPRPPRTNSNRHYFTYPGDIPLEEKQARAAQKNATSDVPQTLTKERIRYGETLRRLELVAEARRLGNELSEIWELED
jgi:hypothetical protein